MPGKGVHVTMSIGLAPSLPDVRRFLQNVDDFGEDDPAVGVYLVKEINRAS